MIPDTEAETVLNPNLPIWNILNTKSILAGILVGKDAAMNDENSFTPRLTKLPFDI